MMGLYINHDEHKHVFKPKGKLTARQQVYYRRDHLSELIQEQNRLNESIKKSLYELNMSHKQQRHVQNYQWNDTRQQLEELYKQNEQQDVTQLISSLEQQITEIIRSNKDDHLKQLDMIHQFHDEVLVKINNYAQQYEDVIEKFSEQTINQQKTDDYLAEQEANQEKITKRLEDQEALTQKLVRQVDHLRSIIFERVSYLADKIDTVYKDTSTYLSQTLTKSVLPASRYIMLPKEKDSKGDSSHES